MPHILLLPGDGIGPEIIEQASKVVEALNARFDTNLHTEQGLIGGAAIEVSGAPILDETIKQAQAADAILLGAVGGPAWDHLPMQERPEKGLLLLRSHFGFFANLRPAQLHPALASASSLKPEVIAGLDMLIVRELTGGIYFGEPRGVRTNEQGMRQGYNTMVYTEAEIERIAHVAFQAAEKRQKKLCSVDKANVLEVSQLWREVVTRVASQYPQVSLSHMYVDNAAMQLVRVPREFDVILTTNMFGDILSDCAAMLTGSIGMLASASLNEKKRGLYEPVHGSAPDIAGQNKANPIATILSLAMLLRYSLDKTEEARALEKAVSTVIESGARTADIAQAGDEIFSTEQMGAAIIEALS